MTQYIYMGDKLTDKRFKGGVCTAIRKKSGKCIRGRSKMLVSFNGEKVVVLAKRLRKIKTVKGLLKLIPSDSVTYRTGYFLTMPSIKGI